MDPPLYSNITVNSTAVYTCIEGTAHPNSSDVTLTCNQNGDWEGPNVTCYYVDCGSPPPMPNATVTTVFRTSYLGIATYSCDAGYVSAQGDVNSTCSADGNWTLPLIDCQVIECGAPPTIALSFSNFSGPTGYLAQAKYQCQSGHTFHVENGWESTFSLTCQAAWNQAVWTGSYPSVSGMSCSPADSYEGCFQSNDSVVLAGNYGEAGCRDTCLQLNNAYAMLKGSQCACADATPSVSADNAQCITRCQNENKLCGGDPDLWSVFSTFQGCFSQLDTEGQFKSLNELTCTERCRGQDSTYAAYFTVGQRCVCYNTTQPSALRLSSSDCDGPQSSGLATVLFLVKVTPPAVSTCEDLFEEGVHVHGDYYLGGSNVVTTCNFYDGSAECGQDWVAYEQHCYYFSTYTGNVTYSEAWDVCLLQDSHLLTINTEQEETFLERAARSVFDFGRWESWHLGLFDHFHSFAHQWHDGSLLNYTGFESREPNVAEDNCVMFKRLNGGALQWYDSQCDSTRSFVCERSPGVYGCVTVPAISNTTVHTFEDDGLMTLTLCFETCRARGVAFAAVIGSTCQCMTSLPTHDIVPWVECNMTCPGNRYQLCGDPNVTVGLAGEETVHAFVIQEDGQLYADSCTGLELQGITGDQLVINDNGIITTVDCTNSGGVTCPYSYAFLGGRCYKFFTRTSPQPAAVCRDMNAYLVVLDDPQEINTVFNDSSVLKGQTSWLIGLFTHGAKGGFYRSSNGRAMQGLSVPRSFTSVGTCVRYQVDTREMEQVVCGELPFVCEKGDDYVGCGIQSENDTLVLNDYPEMSVTQCVELCRGRGDTYALLGNNPYRCYCTVQEPDSLPGAACSQFCFNAHGQPCGGFQSNITSVYQVDYFPVFANSCADLFETDVQVPGIYIINGTAEYCYMKDNSTCSEPNITRWEGVGEGGACFKWSLIAHSVHQSVAKCQDASSQVRHLPASVHTDQELAFLDSMYYMLKDAYLLDNIHIGGEDQFLMGTFTWADGWLMTSPSSSWMNQYPNLNYGDDGESAPGQFIFINQLGSLTNRNLEAKNRKLLCREAPDDLGCVINPLNLTAVISNYSSMSIALCKQTCRAQRANVALLDTGSCFCSLDPGDLLIANDSVVGCDVSCPGNSLQRCADTGFLRAYTIDDRDIAESCDVLHANFIVLNNTYVIKDNVTGSPVAATCGFADTTSCTAGYFGNKGKCYRFFPWTYLDTEQAAKQCFSVGGYLATPRDLEELTFLITTTKSVPSLSTFSHWRLGVMDMMQGQTVVSSDGSVLVSEMWNMTTMAGTTTCTALDVASGTVARDNCLTTLPFVCQTGPVYLGCKSIPFGLETTFDVSTTSVTVQQCVALCFGQDQRYALVTTTTCSCVSYDVIDGSDAATCTEGCRDYYTQACGTESASIYAAYDVDAYTLKEKAAMSCSHYRQLQITAKGDYYNYLADGATTMRVSCGSYGEGHDDILSQEGSQAQYEASTEFAGTAAEARLGMQSTSWSSWQPRNDDVEPWLQVTLSEDYIIKAVVITGSASTNGGHVTELFMDYGFSASSLSDYFTPLYGPSHRTELSVQYLAAPVVAKVVKLRPDKWNIAPALSFTLIGEPYAFFNHLDFYIGCFADPLVSAIDDVISSTSLDKCKDHCSLLGYPLFGLQVQEGTETCGCSNSTGEYGELDATSCNATCAGSTCGSDVTMSVSFYRTYEKKCGEPPELTNTTRSVTPLVPSPYDVFGTGDNVTYSCVTGYEFSNISNSVNITCQQDNTWSDTPASSCQIVSCGNPDIISNGYVVHSDVTYGALATYTCNGRYEMSDGRSVVMTYCSETKAWDPPTPVCSSAKPTRQRTVCKSTPGQQISGSSATAMQTRSGMDCALHCMNHDFCALYSFATNMAALPAGADNCMLHLSHRRGATLVSASGWDVFELGDC
ncbi:uncharacterized protein [Littorina saxatilis]|uniref:uncharacterized protein n=1 Tax=Littorina saxatilis TaxID=31220 RepID=UPI0038B6A946